VAEYISDRREQFASRASNLSSGQKSWLAKFFRRELLDSTKILVLRDEPLANPPFYAELREFGVENLPDFQQMTAVTSNDVVVSHEAFSNGLLFHELVHVEQYRRLGVASFADHYVRGFLAGGGYGGIPLEINAYDLGGRFEADPDHAFSVEDEVSVWIAERRF